MKTCSIDGCDRPHYGRSWCAMHWKRWRAHGTPADGPSITERFWAKVDRTDTCWLWTAGLDHAGYGKFWDGAHKVGAHRYAYQALVGPVPDGLTIDHLCRVRRCVNPAHLEAVTPRENVLRGDTIAARNAAKTHCPRGHPYDEANTYRYNFRRQRSCRACTLDRVTRLRDRERRVASAVYAMSEWSPREGWVEVLPVEDPE